MTSGYPDWLRAFLLLGKHDSDYLPVLLGPDGSMYAVLQGEYAGALKTVKLDDQGRLSAFVVDSSDAWNQMLQIGNAELAARLGSIFRLDRRGTVMLLEGFEDGSNRWGFAQNGPNGAHSITPSKAFSGGYSLRLTAPNDPAEWIYAFMSIPACAATSFGMSVMVRTSTIYDNVLIGFHTYDGTSVHYLNARLHYPTSKVHVKNALGNWQESADYTIDIGANASFHMLKIVANISTDHWVRLLYDNQEYDISAVGVYTLPDVSIPRLYVYIYLLGATGGTNAIAEIDDVIVTAEI